MKSRRRAAAAEEEEEEQVVVAVKDVMMAKDTNAGVGVEQNFDGTFCDVENGACGKTGGCFGSGQN